MVYVWLALAAVFGLFTIAYVRVCASRDALKRELDSLPKRNSKGRFESR